LTGRDIHEFRLWRRDDGGLNAVSLRTQLQTLRVFIRFCETIDAVEDGLSELVRLPNVDREDEQSHDILPSDRANRLLDYLRQFEYASRNHVVLELLWHTGIRVGAARALDVTDYDREDGHIAIRHRPDTETALKNGTRGERLVALAPHVCEAVGDYVEHNRHDVTDDHGRRPLLTSRNGRLAVSSIRGVLYRVTRPCYRTGDCPHDRDTDACEGTEHGQFSRCPSSVSPHAVRRGSITYHLTSDVPEKVVSDRMNVSQDVLEKHYDERTEQQKVEQRRGYLDNL
jgi:integrase